jgi:hypothetical protein
VGEWVGEGGSSSLRTAPALPNDTIQCNLRIRIVNDFNPNTIRESKRSEEIKSSSTVS